MDNDNTKARCDSCHTIIPTYDGVHVSYKRGGQFLCSKCYNETVSEHLGLNFKHISFDPITLRDKDDENHTFHFRTHVFGYNVSIEALEIKEGEPKGYEFAAHGSAEENLFHLFTKLFERMRRAMNRKHIENSDFTRYSITSEDIVRGHITWDDETEGEVPCLVVDGKELSWHEFGKMLMTYEGFHFKLEIFDRSEDK